VYGQSVRRAGQIVPLLSTVEQEATIPPTRSAATILPDQNKPATRPHRGQGRERTSGGGCHRRLADRSPYDRTAPPMRNSRLRAFWHAGNKVLSETTRPLHTRAV
jgi:hypothetical protein